MRPAVGLLLFYKEKSEENENDSLPQVMKRLEYTDNLEYIGVHIHNLLNHNYDMLLDFLNLVDLPVILWLHDYTSVCPESPILLKNRVECCKNFVRSRDVCQNCCYYEKAKIDMDKSYAGGFNMWTDGIFGDTAVWSFCLLSDFDELTTTITAVTSTVCSSRRRCRLMSVP